MMENNFFYCFSCGQETRVIPRILQLRSHWLKSEKESVRLEEAGITKEVNFSLLFGFFHRNLLFFSCAR